MKFFLCLIALYALVVLKASISVWNVKISLNILNRFIIAFNNRLPYEKELKAALRRYPAIKKCTRVARLGHDLSAFSNKYNSEHIYKELQNVEDKVVSDFWRKVRPWNAVVEIICFPINLFSFLPGHPNKGKEGLFWIIDAIGNGIIAYFVGKLLEQFNFFDFFHF